MPSNTHYVVSEQVYPNFKIMIIDLKLIVTKHWCSHVQRRFLRFFLLLREWKLIISSSGNFLQLIKSLQQRLISSEFVCSSKEVIVLSTSGSTLFYLQRRILEIEQQKQVCVRLTCLCRFSNFLQAQHCWLIAAPTLIPESLCFSVVGGFAYPSGPTIFSNLASLKYSLVLMCLHRGACCFLKSSSVILRNSSVSLVTSISQSYSVSKLLVSHCLLHIKALGNHFNLILICHQRISTIENLVVIDRKRLAIICNPLSFKSKNVLSRSIVLICDW